MQVLRNLFFALVVILVYGSIQWYRNQPQEAGVDVPSGKLKSLSFAPFPEGYSPLEKKYPLREHVDGAMKLLADKTETIRTYSSLGGMEPTPELARQYGLNVLQGAWIGGDLSNNRREVNALIKSANENPDVVKRVIVGNEVLLRGELDVDRLIAYIREVKKAVKQPVSYADVWSMYMKHPKLIAEVDFITIHILPYWEDEPVSVDRATEHLESIVGQVAQEAEGVAPGKPILIGESGWPSAGRQRGLAVPGVVNEAKYVRGLIQVAQHHGFDYNIVEAFNQPWKSHLEGVVGANWGLLSVNHEPVFPLTGPVYEHSDWLENTLLVSAFFMSVVLLTGRSVSSLEGVRLLVFYGLMIIMMHGLVHLGHFEWYTSYSAFQRSYTAMIVLLNSLLAWQLGKRFLIWLREDEDNEKLNESIRQLYSFFMLLAIYKTFMLAYNGRYLSFPVEQMIIPVIGVIGLIICHGMSRKRLAIRFNTICGAAGQYDNEGSIALFLGAFALIIGEFHAFMVGRDFILAHPQFSDGLPFALRYTLENAQLVNWLLWLILMALPFWRNRSIHSV